MKTLQLTLRHLVALAAFLPLSCFAQASAVPEFTMKAAYLYNFAQLTEWPADSIGERKDFNLCVIGQDEVLEALEPMRGRKVDGRPLNPMRITDAAEAQACNLVYIGEFAGKHGARLLLALQGVPAVTVADDRLLVATGAMITLLRDSRRLAFEVDLGSAKRAQIKFSSKLLGLAQWVKRE